MLRIDPKQTPIPKLHGYLLGSIGPRPIAFASTIDKEGNPNLSPFSFFNAFSANPPIAIFSPARRGRDNTTKHTYENVKEVAEVVINIVTYDMVHQASLSSTEYPKGVSEFEKAGFTPVASELIAPFRVKESPVQMECKVIEVRELGDQGAAGNLVICEVLLMHINEDLLDENGVIDQQKIDLVGRMGGSWYCRAHGDALFKIPKPLTTLGMGIDNMPEHIRQSKILSGNDLGMLGNVEQLPASDDVSAFKVTMLSGLFESHGQDQESLTAALHKEAKTLLEKGKVMEAWKVLLSSDL